MGREPDEVALLRGPEGSRSSSLRGANHPTTLAGARAAQRYTAGRDRKGPDRVGRLGPGGPGRRGRPEEDNHSSAVGQEWSYKTSYRTANLAKRIRTYDSEFESPGTSPHESQGLRVRTSTTRANAGGGRNVARRPASGARATSRSTAGARPAGPSRPGRRPRAKGRQGHGPATRAAGALGQNTLPRMRLSQPESKGPKAPAGGTTGRVSHSATSARDPSRWSQERTTSNIETTRTSKDDSKAPREGTGTPRYRQAGLGSRSIRHENRDSTRTPRRPPIDTTRNGPLVTSHGR